MTEFTTIEKLAMSISPSYDAIVRYVHKDLIKLIRCLIVFLH